MIGGLIVNAALGNKPERELVNITINSTIHSSNALEITVKHAHARTIPENLVTVNNLARLCIIFYTKIKFIFTLHF